MYYMYNNRDYGLTVYYIYMQLYSFILVILCINPDYYAQEFWFFDRR